MRFLGALGLFAFFPLALSVTDAPPESIAKACKALNQVPQKQADGRWICVSSICGPDQDQSTLHLDAETGKWGCCPKGQILKGDTCGFKNEPKPGTCEARIKEAGLESTLRSILAPCFPCDGAALDSFIKYYMDILNRGVDFVHSIYENGCGKPGPSPGPFPDPSPDPGPDPGPRPEWWRCPKDKSSPCKWLNLENNKAPKSLPGTGAEHKVLPNPNAPVPNYKYPFDTWVTKFPDDSLDIYVKGEKLEPQAGGTKYLIPAGTSADDVYYKASSSAQIQFHGACSADTPCIGDEVVPWTEGAVTVANRNADIDVSGYDSDLVFTMADTWITTEQYTVLADGKEVGKTHGRLSLGDDKYNTKHISNVNVDRGPYGALRSIANDGFWGSFLIPKGTKKVTVHLSFEGPGYPNYVFQYRIDKLCRC